MWGCIPARDWETSFYYVCVSEINGRAMKVGLEMEVLLHDRDYYD